MIFNPTEYSIFFIIFFILIGLIIWLSLELFWLLKKERKKFPPPKNPPSVELFLWISENFKKQLEELIAREIQRNFEEFKNAFQKTSEEIIKDYKNQFTDGNQEIQKVLSEFSRQIIKKTSNLGKFTLEAQNKISEEARNKILELNQLAEKEFIKIQETNLKVSTQLSQSLRETLSEKIQETEKEIENYKKEKLKEVDQKIYQILGEVAKKTIGKTIDLSTHEELVIEALEKAKREKIF